MSPIRTLLLVAGCSICSLPACMVEMEDEEDFVGTQGSPLWDQESSLFGFFETTLSSKTGALVVGDSFEVTAVTRWTDTTDTSTSPGTFYGTTTCKRWVNSLFHLNGEFSHEKLETYYPKGTFRSSIRIVLDNILSPNLIVNAPDFTTPNQLVAKRWDEKRTFTCVNPGPFSLDYLAEIGSTEYWECDMFLSSRTTTPRTPRIRTTIDGYCWDPDKLKEFRAGLGFTEDTTGDAKGAAGSGGKADSGED